jgi:hypothetical protein
MESIILRPTDLNTMHAHTPWLDGKFRRRELFVLAHARGRPWLELAQPRHGRARLRRPSRSSPAPPHRGARRRRHLAVVARAGYGVPRPCRPWRISPAPPLAGSPAPCHGRARPRSPSRSLPAMPRRGARLAPGRGHPHRSLRSLPSPPLVVGGNAVGNGELSARGRDWEWERVVVFILANSRKN